MQQTGVDSNSFFEYHPGTMQRVGKEDTSKNEEQTTWHTLNRSKSSPWLRRKTSDMSNPLVVMVGIGDYKGNCPDLAFIGTDYEHIKFCINSKRKYTLICCDSKNNLLTLETGASDSRSRYKWKQKWNTGDINQFNRELSKKLMSPAIKGENYDGLLYIMISLGDDSNSNSNSNSDCITFYDSDMNSIKTDTIVNGFTDENCEYFRGKPKLFLFECCQLTKKKSQLQGQSNADLKAQSGKIGMTESEKKTGEAKEENGNDSTSKNGNATIDEVESKSDDKGENIGIIQVRCPAHPRTKLPSGRGSNKNVFTYQDVNGKIAKYLKNNKDNSNNNNNNNDNNKSSSNNEDKLETIIVQGCRFVYYFVELLSKINKNSDDERRLSVNNLISKTTKILDKTGTNMKELHIQYRNNLTDCDLVFSNNTVSNNNNNNSNNNNDEKEEAPKLIGSKSLENKKPESKPYLSSWAMKAAIEPIAVRNPLVVIVSVSKYRLFEIRLDNARKSAKEKEKDKEKAKLKASSVTEGDDEPEGVNSNCEDTGGKGNEHNGNSKNANDDVNLNDVNVNVNTPEIDLYSLHTVSNVCKEIMYTFSYINGFSFVFQGPYGNVPKAIWHFREGAATPQDCSRKFKYQWTCDEIKQFNDYIQNEILTLKQIQIENKAKHQEKKQEQVAKMKQTDSNDNGTSSTSSTIRTTNGTTNETNSNKSNSGGKDPDGNEMNGQNDKMDDSEELKRERERKERELKYDGLIYIITGHGWVPDYSNYNAFGFGGNINNINGKPILYDSTGDTVDLENIFNMFCDQNCSYLKHKPKVFIVDVGNNQTGRKQDMMNDQNDEKEKELEKAGNKQENDKNNKNKENESDTNTNDNNGENDLNGDGKIHPNGNKNNNDVEERIAQAAKLENMAPEGAQDDKINNNNNNNNHEAQNNDDFSAMSSRIEGEERKAVGADEIGMNGGQQRNKRRRKPAYLCDELLAVIYTNGHGYDSKFRRSSKYGNIMLHSICRSFYSHDKCRMSTHLTKANSSMPRYAKSCKVSLSEEQEQGWQFFDGPFRQYSTNLMRFVSKRKKTSK